MSSQTVVFPVSRLHTGIMLVRAVPIEKFLGDERV
jgi:hypothetical protein